MWFRRLVGLQFFAAEPVLAGPPSAQSSVDEDLGTVEGTLRPTASLELSVDRSCWTDLFTVELCCLPSFKYSSEIGCWEHDDQWEFCCRAFLLWRPPRSPESIRRLHEEALGFVLQKNLHEGMVFGRIAAAMGYTRCVEVGVFGGTWSEFFLVFGTSVDRRLDPGSRAEVRDYTLVDIWRRDEQVLGDGSLGTNLYSARAMQGAVRKLERFWPRVSFVQKASLHASRLFDEASLDFVFIDAGHDVCSVREDLDIWWPKVRSGGLLAGDDYADVETVKELYGDHQDWSTCANGTVHPGAVLGAVDDFARDHGVQMSIFRMMGASLSPQWLIFKP